MEIFAIHVWIKVSNSKNSPERFLSLQNLERNGGSEKREFRTQRNGTKRDGVYPLIPPEVMQK
jgi:hypothetical protein